MQEYFELEIDFHIEKEGLVEILNSPLDFSLARRNFLKNHNWAEDFV